MYTFDFYCDCRYSEYQAIKDTAPKKGEQLRLLQFGVAEGSKYGLEHHRQKRITRSIIEDLIIDCSIPISIVDKAAFQRFMCILDEKYRMMGRLVYR